MRLARLPALQRLKGNEVSIALGWRSTAEKRIAAVDSSAASTSTAIVGPKGDEVPM
jgi:hypothetical protein